MLINAFAGRTLVKSLSLNDKDGNAITLSSQDVIRLKIGRDGMTPVVDLSTKAATANGSSLTWANPTVLMLKQGDLTFAAGVYDLEVLLIDYSQNAAVKLAAKGIFTLHDAQLGEVSA